MTRLTYAQRVVYDYQRVIEALAAAGYETTAAEDTAWIETLVVALQIRRLVDVVAQLVPAELVPAVEESEGP